MAAFVGIPYSYFYALHARLLRTSWIKRRGGSAKELFAVMAGVIGISTVLFPVGFSWFYRTNPLELERIQREKDLYIDDLRWSVRELFRGVGDYVEMEDERLNRAVENPWKDNKKGAEAGDAGKQWLKNFKGAFAFR
jgi:hypothetical protein